jgi:phage terminase large subunit
MQIDINLTGPQMRFVGSQEKYPAIIGGLGSGKSRAGTMRLLALMLQTPGANGAYYMPTYDLLNLRALPGIVEDLEMMEIPYNFNSQKMTISVYGYGNLILRSYDNPKRIVAYEVAHSIVDELDTLPIDKGEEVWRKITERNRQKIDGMVNTIGCVTTPDQGFNGIVYKKWVKDVKDGYHLIKAPTYSNPYLPGDYIEQIRANYDPLLADMYIEGEFVNLSADKVYHFFDRVKHHSDRVLEDTDYSIHVSIDFNVGGCCATVSVLEKGYPITVDEFSSNNTYQFIENLQIRYPKKKITIYPDASGASDSTNASKSDIQLIKQAGYNVSAPKANPLIRNRVNAVNKGFSHSEFKINTDKCPRLTHALENQGYDKQGKPEKFNEHPAIDDWVDSYGYFIHRKYPINKPVTNTNVRFAI